MNRDNRNVLAREPPTSDFGRSSSRKYQAMEKSVPVNIQELIVSSLAQSDALAKLLMEKGLIHSRSSCKRSLRSGRRIRDY